MEQNIVVIPTFNEIENIEEILYAVMDLDTPFDVLVVDDNSPDGTSEKVLQVAQEFPDRIFLKKRLKKNGLGTAYVAGFNWALNTITNIFLKWMPIFRTIPTIYPDFYTFVKMVLMLLLVRVM